MERVGDEEELCVWWRFFWSGRLGVCVGERGESYEKVFVSHVSSKIRSIFINKVIGFQAKMIEHDGKYWF